MKLTNETNIDSQKIRIALIGAGYWGKNLARNFSALGVLACICDNDSQSANSLAKKYNIPVLSLDEILQREDISAVAIVTPAFTHYEIAKRCLEANKHVFIEKPMVLYLDHAKKLYETSRQMQKILMVGHLLQYHPVFIKLKELVHAGELGKIRYLYSHRLDCGKIYPKKDVLWNLAPHDLSMILSLVKSSPEAMDAKASCNLKDGVPDFAMIHLKFPEKIQAHLFVSWLNPFKEHKLTIIGDKKMVVFDDTQTEWDKKLAIYDHKISIDADIITTIKEEPAFIKVEKSEPLKNECQYFIDCIMHNKKPITDGQEALKIIEILEKAKTLFKQETIEATG